jgi:GNAT superfamily N-acetyltransferase
MMNIRKMTAADIPFGMRLKAQNNWNQIEADWHRQLAIEPDGCFIADHAGTACCCAFDDVAWINMVLVDRGQRGRGVGTALMRHVLQYLDNRNVPCIRLDATALGQPVYAKLGFVDDFALDRYEGILPSPSGRGAGGEGSRDILPITPTDLPELAAFDRAVTKASRAKLLQHIFDNVPECSYKYVSHGQLEGYCMARPGSNAWQLGPIQGSPKAGRALLLNAASRFAGQRVYLDVPTVNTEAITLAQSLDLTVQRSFLRMTRGCRMEERLDLFWTSFGPEKG